MKRRQFLSLLSSTGLIATFIAADEETGTMGKRSLLSGGDFHLSHRRQGISYPVQVTLSLPQAEDLEKPPTPIVFRELAEGWSEPISYLHSEATKIGSSWVWEWVPPAVVPTAAERAEEMIRFRLVLLDALLGERVVSDTIEVVCTYRGWSA
jgi:hypothetical protein